MVQLYAHQKEAIEFMSDKRSAWIQYEVGLGKTLICLEHIKNKKEYFKKILIVCPKNVVSVWSREVKNFGYDFKVVELVGTTNERITKIKIEADIYVINYDGLRYIHSQLLAANFDTIFIDESHRAKDKTAKQTQILHQLSDKAEFKYALTGTPMTKSPEDIWAQVYFLNKNFLPNWFVFCAKYIEYRKFTIRTGKGVREIRNALGLKYSKKGELQNILSSFTIRKTKEECLDLPDKIYKRIEVDLTPEQKKEYMFVRGDIKKLIKNYELNKETANRSVQKLQQICQGFIYNDKGVPRYLNSSCKIEALKELLDDLHGKNIIIFTYYKADIESVKNAIPNDWKVLVYDGTNEERLLAIDTFQKNESPCVFLSNVERAKEGITLTAASDVIYFGNSYNLGTRLQSEGRPHRIGQKNNVVYYDIVAKNTVDERVTKILVEKHRSADEITGDSVRLAMMEMEGE